VSYGGDSKRVQFLPGGTEKALAGVVTIQNQIPAKDYHFTITIYDCFQVWICYHCAGSHARLRLRRRVDEAPTKNNLTRGSADTTTSGADGEVGFRWQ
jgi:hypothetical protein